MVNHEEHKGLEGFSTYFVVFVPFVVKKLR